MKGDIKETSADVAFRCETRLGEGPLWHPDENALYWIDLIGKRLFRGDGASGAVTSKPLPFRCARVTLVEDGRLLFSFTRGFAFGHYDSEDYTPFEASAIIGETERYNDGACDSRGRFWTGTYDVELQRPIGGIYRFEGHVATREADGVILANGLRWSPDERQMFFADSRPGQLWVYDFDADAGRVGARRLLVDYAGTGAKPDGCATDADGCVWIAEVHRSRVARYTPAGALDQVVMLPTRRPTSVSFGDSDARTLYITTRNDGMSASDFALEPHAGCVFAARVEVPGLAEYRFKV
ncbi:sugar lactone lactonase YvrE [Paraburkholderia unamae]|uniref:SMP-30/gluconolactonase/LRE family protein n=1 Tax=Paraburkholderia unamae TaxID=219649 RepID=UPI000DC5712D|nr:SMP-30/gluconolactonase/LRE family protein [Paraburkholderia unamae]RAR56417.1 sugar lactone lactonase YvrE [Paraburkholderia unamae]